MTTSRMVRILDNTQYTEENSEEYKLLKSWGACTIGSLMNSKKNTFIVYTYSLQKTEDKLKENAPVISYNGKTYRTGNVVGFIRHKDNDIHIHSRFSSENDYFIYYMLEKVMSINLFSNKAQSFHTKGLNNLLWVFFPALLNRALTQGVYKKYVYHSYNNPNIKGIIDIKQHIRLNYPLNGKIAYKTRELSYDNSVTQLIRHTIEYMKRNKDGKIFLEKDSTTKESVQLIVKATPTYNAKLLKTVFIKNLKPVVHPYYNHYTALHQLCMNILNNDTMEYRLNGQNHDFGILIDVAWLWEEYLDTIFKRHLELDYKHPHNKMGRENDSFNIFEDNSLKEDTIPYIQPDFYNEGKWVIDAKYKPYSTLLLQPKDTNTGTEYLGLRNDRLQILAYMYLTKASHGIIAVPGNTNVTPGQDFRIKRHEDKSHENTFHESAYMHLVALPVNSAGINDYHNYIEEMKQRESQFTELIKNIIDGQ